jgi:hypothetical protein
MELSNSSGPYVPGTVPLGAPPITKISPSWMPGVNLPIPYNHLAHHYPISRVQKLPRLNITLDYVLSILYFIPPVIGLSIRSFCRSVQEVEQRKCLIGSIIGRF